MARGPFCPRQLISVSLLAKRRERGYNKIAMIRNTARSDLRTVPAVRCGGMEKPMKNYVFGVDLGGTTAKLGLLDSSGTLLDKWEIPTRTENAGVHILPDIAATLDEALARSGVAKESVLGAGIGVPGAVTGDGFTAPCVNLDGWGGFDVSRRLGELCGFPVRTANDANVAALGEMWMGGGRGSANMVLVTLGTGVGGGVIVDGRILTGIHGAAGEIGHIKVAADEPEPCGCGKHGCLEQYASATGIVHQAMRLLAGGEPSTLRGAGELTAKMVVDHAKDGDRLACKVVDLFSDSLGKALATVSCVCDPDVFVLGGGVSRAGSFLLDPVKAAFRKYAFPAAEETRFGLAILGNDAGVYGAAKLILDELEA